MILPNRICLQCGTPLAANEMFCSNCGTRYIEQPVVEPTQQATPYANPSSPSQPNYEPTQYAGPGFSNTPNPYASTAYGSSGPNYAPIQPVNQMNPTPPPPPFAGNAPGMYGQAGQPMPGQIGGYPQAGGFPQQVQQKKKGPNVGLIIGIVLLVLLVACGTGSYLVYRAVKNIPTTLSTTPTATVSTQPTAQALFSDNFADNSKGWDTTGGTGFSRDISNHVLTMTEANHKILTQSFPTTSTYSDLTVTATFTFLQGDLNDSVGIYVRGDTNLDHDYRVDFYGDNSYSISKEYVDSSNNIKIKSIVDPVSTSTLKPLGQQNTVSVIMKGTQLVLVINNTTVKSVSDSDYNSGQVALFLQNGDSSQGAKATFSFVAIYPAPDQLPN